MRKITVANMISLDGVMQSPGGKEEDNRNGFEHGGWAVPYNDEVKGKEMAKGMAQKSELLFGRRTYEHFFKVWPGRKDNPFTEVLDNTTKYLVSNSMKKPLPWKNSVLLSGDPTDSIAKLKAKPGPNLVILGSGVLIQSLMKRNLIDVFQLQIHPLVLGSGFRMFADDGALAKFNLTNSVTTTTGVIIATYNLANAE
jgi:dihydrofolate reductase